MTTEVFIAVDRDECYRATLPPGEYLIGRDPEAQIRIEHPTISRRHARLIVDEDQLLLADLDSGNGTMIEETPVVGARHFYEGETARLGDVLLRARQSVTVDALPPSVGHYRKGDVVGAGGMGAIHEARQSAMGRKVAMKVMLREQSKSGLRRFINEARVTGMLEHPNIVPVHELGVDTEGRAFYTMKFVHGTTLAEVLAGVRTEHPDALKKHSLGFLLTVFQKVCDAIAFAHSRGVHHRDLKPENIMIGDFGEVLVMDWGLSKETGFAGEAEEVLPGVSSSDDAECRTMEGSVLGTPAYMSPEQARGEVEAVDARSDIYCLGAILHEILYLQPPVSGSSALEIVDKVGRGQIDPLPEAARPHWPGGRVPASLEAVRGKAMAFDAARRYPSVTDLQSDITAYQAGFATSAEEAGVATQAMLFYRRNRGVTLAVLGGLSLLGVVSSVLITNLWHQVSQTEAARKEAEENANIAVTAQGAAEKTSANLAATVAQLNDTIDQLKKQERMTDAEKKRADKSESEGDAQRARVDELKREKEQDAKKFFDSAEKAVMAVNLNEAESLLASAIANAPDDPKYLERKADLLMSSGQFNKAADVYREALEKGAGERAKQNLAWCEAQEEAGLASPETYANLASLLDDQGRHAERPFLDAAWAASAKRSEQEASTGAASMAVPEELRSLAGWSDERFKVSGERIELNLSGLPIDSLASLTKLPLRSLDLRGTAAVDLSPLTGVQLEVLSVAEGTSDLSPLRVDGLRVLDLSGSRVADLGVLQGAGKLEELRLDDTLVQSLEPLRGKPLKVLSADVREVKDFAVVESLGNLEELTLPRHAAGVPVAGLEALKKVRHPRFQSSGEIEGAKFKELSKKSDEAWRRWRGQLVRLVGPVLGPDRVTVVEEVWTAPRGFPNAFDLDLRGLEVNDLRLLRDIPVNRLYLDTKAKPVDLRPLAGHPELKHLVLAGANVPTLQGVLDRQALESIVLSEETADVRRLKGHPKITRAGYEFDESTRLPTTTVKELFEGRDRKAAIPDHPDRGRRTEPAFLFDDPGMTGAEEVRKWALLPPGDDGESARVWKPDPPKEGGRGGGYVQFFERKEDNQMSYFQLPTDFRLKKKNLYGSSLGFELTAKGDGELKMGLSDVIVRAGTNSLHYTFLGQNPSPDWRWFQVILKEGPGWKVGSPSGSPATQEEMKAVLDRVSGFEIRAEYHAGGNYERTGVDNAVLWDREETERRVWNEMEKEKEKGKWISVESDVVRDLRAKLGLARASNDDSPHRAAVYESRYGPTLVRPFSAAQPARLRLNPEAAIEAGTLVRFAARGAPSGSGVSVRVVQNGVPLQEWAVGGARWTEFSVELPQGSGGKGGELCVLEVRPNGEIDPYCFIVGVELVPPSGRR